jgi:hypothetical protein
MPFRRLHPNPETGHTKNPTLIGKTFNRDESDEGSSTGRIYHALLDYRAMRKPLLPSSVPLTESATKILSQSLRQSGLLTYSLDDILLSNTIQTKPSSSSIPPPALPKSEISYGDEETDSRVSIDSPSVQLSPDEIARQFAESAARALDANEVGYLIDFLQKPRLVGQRPSRQLIRAKLDAFFETEIAITREPRDRLADPSGPEDAELGIILHCQTMKGHVGEFWNPESRTIQLLSAKGLSPEFIYGFDWHWRAEESARRPGKTACPTKRWPIAKRSIHDEFSRELLELLPLPWLIIGGSCAKDSYRRTLSPLAKQVLVPLSETVNLQIELDIQENGIKRIAIYVPHPSSGFFQPSSSSNYGIVLDASISFLLWLQYKEGNSSVFTTTMSTIPRGVPSAAPFAELYSYRKRETNLGRKLTEHEYQPAFLSWAATYLPESPLNVLGRGDSLADSLIKVVGDKISVTKQLNGFNAVQTGRKGPASRYHYEFKQIWDGQCVSVTKKGSFKIFLSDDQPSLELKGGRPLQAIVSKSSEPVTIHFSENDITLQQGGVVVFRKTCASIEDQDLRARWVEQVRIECIEKADSSKALITEPITKGTSFRQGREDVSSTADDQERQ